MGAGLWTAWTMSFGVVSAGALLHDLREEKAAGYENEDEWPDFERGLLSAGLGDY